MKDHGIDKGLVREFETSSKKVGYGKGLWGFRKMFWTYLNKLHVAFADCCCEDASDAPAPVRYNTSLGRLEYFDCGTETWKDIPGDGLPTTTTTTTSSTTTTTTAAPVSDTRLKTNIQPTGNNYSVLKEYTWEWNDEAKRLGLDHYPTVGVLAQEALQVCPEIVQFDENIGYYRVDTSKLIKE